MFTSTRDRAVAAGDSMLHLDGSSDDATHSALEAIQTQLAAQVWTMFVDHVTASVTTMFEEHGIPSILLKGPAFARLFYGEDCDRYYSDTDLLVKIGDRERAEQSLLQSGFERVDRDEDWLGPAPKYAHTFVRLADRATVDLHWSLSGATVSPRELWQALSAHTTNLEVAGRLVVVLDVPASAMLVALHSAHHGTLRQITVTDLDRAANRLDLETWLDAVCLADEVGASETFAVGLRVSTTGDALADRLGLDRPASVELWLKNSRSSYGAWVLDRLSQSSTFRGKVQIGLQVALPPRVVMYRFFPLARRGQFGLSLAYLLRPPRLIVHSGPALREWLRARRAVRTRAF